VIFGRTPLEGAVTVDAELVTDERGWFARLFAVEEFERRGLDPAVAHVNASFNERAGTLRGMHYQAAPEAEAKLVRCVRGALFDVIVDLRPDSATYCQWHAEELTAGNRRCLYVPEGMAHGFQTLEAATEVLYLMSRPYAPSHAAGVRWNDPAFHIEWPDAERTISERDMAYPDFRP
jgi:dTDP-4-dehydrorhamnose 3,5-epimerase